MSTQAKKPVVAGPQAVDINADVESDGKLTEKTAARLRDICERTGETFDGSLSEQQALRRIAALEEVHALS